MVKDLGGDHVLRKILMVWGQHRSMYIHVAMRGFLNARSASAWWEYLAPVRVSDSPMRCMRTVLHAIR